MSKKLQASEAPICPLCGSESEFYDQEIAMDENGTLALVDYFLCKNQDCENSKPDGEATVVK